MDTLIRNQFARDVINGLNSNPKRLSSKYFYNEKGDELFQHIMQLDEYYLTRTEYLILDQYKHDLLEIFSADAVHFNLVEFGAGDGYKTKILLEHFLSAGADFKYVPIDISGNVLGQLEDSLNQEFPDLEVDGIQNEYFRALKQLENGASKNVVLFLGSNIGNFTGDQATSFIKGLYDGINDGDLLLIGFDLKKDPEVILSAYNDPEGVTRDFNFNLLERINNELDGNFDLSKFKHYPTYDPMTGTTTSYLVSLEKQRVEIMDQAVDFDAWEAIHMEISQKYSMEHIEKLATEVGFKVKQNFFDDRKYFLNAVWEK